MPTVFRSPIPTISRPNWRPISRPTEHGPLFAAYLAEIPREAPSTVNFLVDLNAQLQKKIRYIIRMEPGIQTPEETLASGAGSCRDSAWLLIQIVAASRARRAFRLGLSHSVAARHRSGRRTARGRERFYRSACLGRSLSAGRGLDRFRRHLGHADRRGAYSGRRHAALPLGGADQRRGRICQCRIRLRDERQAHPRSAADHPAVLRRILGAARQARRAGRCRSEGRRRAPDHGRRADLRLGRRSGIAGMEYRRGRSDQARPCRRSHPQAARRASRRAACCITARANGIPAKACRAGRSGSTGARTACRSGRTPT